eukprot:TRINITY_DN4186_c0_g1_i1.p1 TRINITY_DN4186_c0_g1~~TRINITY_DN4186_c0_g1_i1.p1  ORF type:complete len:810 (-),score=283.23 TRINITY_DN4186_c0_g1_i1:190-2472(-)
MDWGAFKKREAFAKLLSIFWKAALRKNGFSIDASGFPNLLQVVKAYGSRPGIRLVSHELERQLRMVPGSLFGLTAAGNLESKSWKEEEAKKLRESRAESSPEKVPAPLKRLRDRPMFLGEAKEIVKAFRDALTDPAIARTMRTIDERGGPHAEKHRRSLVTQEWNPVLKRFDYPITEAGYEALKADIRQFGENEYVCSLCHEIERLCGAPAGSYFGVPSAEEKRRKAAEEEIRRKAEESAREAQCRAAEEARREREREEQQSHNETLVDECEEAVTAAAGGSEDRGGSVESLDAAGEVRAGEAAEAAKDEEQQHSHSEALVDECEEAVAAAAGGSEDRGGSVESLDAAGEVRAGEAAEAAKDEEQQHSHSEALVDENEEAVAAAAGGSEDRGGSVESLDAAGEVRAGEAAEAAKDEEQQQTQCEALAEECEKAVGAASGKDEDRGASDESLERADVGDRADATASTAMDEPQEEACAVVDAVATDGQLPDATAAADEATSAKEEEPVKPGLFDFDELQDEAENSSTADSDEAYCFEVVHDRIALREQPSPKANIVGVARRGVQLFCTRSRVHSQWLHVERESCRQLGALAEEAWALLDGSSLGLGALLQPASKRLPQELGYAGRFEVSHSRVAVRASPSMEGKVVGVVFQGRILMGTPHSVAGEAWLRFEESSRKKLVTDGEEAWALILGRPLGLGPLLRPLDADGRRVLDSLQETHSKESPVVRAPKEEEKQPLEGKELSTPLTAVAPSMSKESPSLQW